MFQTTWVSCFFFSWFTTVFTDFGLLSYLLQTWVLLPAIHTFYCCYSARNLNLQCIYETLRPPLSRLGNYFWRLEMVAITSFYNNSTMDFKMVRWFEQKHIYLWKAVWGNLTSPFLHFEVTIHQPKCLSKMPHYWSCDLRVAHKFACCINLRVARESRTHTHTPHTYLRAHAHYAVCVVIYIV